MVLNVGQMAPDFELDSHQGRKVTLSSFRRTKNVVVAFHPLAWTPVCTNQMQSYELNKAWFDIHDTHILGISVDAIPSKIEWAKSLGGVSYDLLSDFHPDGAVAKAYGVTRNGGISERTIFIIDKAGTIIFAKMYDIPTFPDITDVKQTIEKLD